MDSGVCPGVSMTSRTVTELEAVAVGELPDREVGLGRLAVADPGSRGLGELHVTGDEVGVEVGVEDTHDLETVLLGVGEVLLDVASRVDHDGLAGLLVADEVRRLREAVEVELREVHGLLLYGRLYQPNIYP